MEGGRITAIAVVESQETPDIGGKALEQLIPAVVEAQGPVDAVSGATLTSKAFDEAVRDALTTKEGQ